MTETKKENRKGYETWYFRLGLTMLIGIIAGFIILELEKMS